MPQGGRRKKGTDNGLCLWLESGMKDGAASGQWRGWVSGLTSHMWRCGVAPFGVNLVLRSSLVTSYPLCHLYYFHGKILYEFPLAILIPGIWEHSLVRAGDVSGEDLTFACQFWQQKDCASLPERHSLLLLNLILFSCSVNCVWFCLCLLNGILCFLFLI